MPNSTVLAQALVAIVDDSEDAPNLSEVRNLSQLPTNPLPAPPRGPGTSHRLHANVGCTNGPEFHPGGRLRLKTERRNRP
jgi:hypothetical protein